MAQDGSKEAPRRPKQTPRWLKLAQDDLEQLFKSSEHERFVRRRRGQGMLGGLMTEDLTEDLDYDDDPGDGDTYTGDDQQDAEDDEQDNMLADAIESQDPDQAMAFVSYVAARRHLQKVRQSRGFVPVQRPPGKGKGGKGNKGDRGGQAHGNQALVPPSSLRPGARPHQSRQGPAQRRDQRGGGRGGRDGGTRGQAHLAEGADQQNEPVQPYDVQNLQPIPEEPKTGAGMFAFSFMATALIALGDLAVRPGIAWFDCGSTWSLVGADTLTIH